jgi:hypothetical protein
MDATAALNKICHEVGVCEARESEAHSSSSEFVWIKMGAVGEYEKFNTPYEAGSAVARKLGLHVKELEHLRFGYQASAINIEPVYVGYNRISLFWGDDYCHWIRDLSPAEQRDFERGLTT